MPGSGERDRLMGVGVTVTGCVGLDNGERYKLARMGKRVWARTIDLFLLFLCGAVHSLLLLFGLGLSLGASDPTVTRMVGFSWVIITIVYALILILYEPVMLAVFGRTVGKKAAGLHVIQIGDAKPPGWKKSWIRWGVFIVVWLATLSLMRLLTGATPGYYFSDILLFERVWIPAPVPGLDFAFGYIPLLSCIGAKRRQGWHDKAAGTLVVTIVHKTLASR